MERWKTRWRRSSQSEGNASRQESCSLFTGIGREIKKPMKNRAPYQVRDLVNSAKVPLIRTISVTSILLLTIQSNTSWRKRKTSRSSSTPACTTTSVTWAQSKKRSLSATSKRPTGRTLRTMVPTWWARTLRARCSNPLAVVSSACRR